MTLNNTTQVFHPHDTKVFQSVLEQYNKNEYRLHDCQDIQQVYFQLNLHLLGNMPQLLFDDTLKIIYPAVFIQM